MTGTAEMLAEDMRDSVQNHTVELLLAERTTVDRVGSAEFLVVVSSTYGSGEVPEPAKPLFAALDAHPVRLSHVQYGVVALGDLSLYAPTFANGGRQWDALLEKKGARRATDTLIIDCSSAESMSEPATAWFRCWLESIATTVA